MVSKNSYIKGLNQDLSFTKVSPEFYYNGRNIRIITRDGESTGSVTNEKGNEFLVKIPDIRVFYGHNLSSPSQKNLKIIGTATIRDEIFVFTTNETGEPNNSYGQIWSITYNNDYTPSLRLLYNNICNFSTLYPIKAIGNYETESVKKLYWSDGYNQLRSFNVASLGDNQIVTVGFTVDKTCERYGGIINMAPIWDFNEITIDSVENGGVFNASMVRYAYCQFNKNHAQTKISPITDVIPINDYDSVKLPGNLVGKSVNLSLQLDANFDRVKLYRIQYAADKVNPAIYEVYSGNYNSTNFTFTDTGLTTHPQLSLENFLLQGGDAWIVKDFVQKDNRLLIANITESNYDVEYEARAYRFTRTQKARLYDKEGNLEYTIEGDKTLSTFPFTTQTTWADIDDDADVVCPYNYITSDVTKPGGSANYDVGCSYQSDGDTIGGEGINVSYTFGISTKEIDSNYGVESALMNTESTSNINFQRYTSRGYARGEVYRFGVVFYNEKNQKSKVKWIGDIRFPDFNNFYDSYNGPRVDGITSVAGTTTFSKNLFIQFQLSNLPSDATKYQIVRAERTDNDKTVISTGIYNPCYIATDSPGSEAADDGLLMPSPWLTPSGQILGAAHVDTRKLDYIQEPNISYQSGVTRNMVPHYSLIFSPDLVSSEFIPNPDSDYIESIGAMSFKTRLKVSSLPSILPTTLEGSLDGMPAGNYMGVSDKSFIYKGNVHSHPTSIPSAIVEPYSFPLTSSIKIPEYDSVGYMVKSDNYLSYSGRTSFPTFSNYFRLKKYDLSPGTTYTLNQITYGGKSLLVAPDVTLVTSTVFGQTGGIVNGFNTCSLVRYRRYLAKQYGGYDYEGREKQAYISCSPIIDSTTLTLNVERGDVFIGFSNMLMNKASATITVDNDYGQFSCKLLMPLETTTNPDLDAGLKFNAWGNKYVTNSNYTNILTSNNVSTNILKDYPKNDDFDVNENFDSEIRYSDVKISGESVDSMLEFKSNNFQEVEGEYGPINALSKWSNEVFVFQDNAIARLVVNPNTQIVGQDGVIIQLGRGNVIQNINYISTTSGSYNKFGIISSPTGIFYFDLLNLKLMKLESNGTKPLVDLEGLGGYFRTSLKDYMSTLKIDNPVLRQGVTGTYDINNMEALYTLMASEAFVSPSPGSGSFTLTDSNHLDGLNVGDVIIITISGGDNDGNNYNGTITGFNGNTVNFDTDYNFSLGESWSITYYVGSYYTIAYSDMISGFTSFYDYAPSNYIYDSKNLLSTNPSNTSLYIHGIGDYGVYYDSTPHESYIELIVNGGEYADYNKIFDGIEFYSEVYDANGVNIPDETIDRLFVTNSYQTTKDTILVPNTNIRKRHKVWYTHIPRQFENQVVTRNRIKDNWIKLKLTKDNSTNNRLILHDIITNFRIAKY